MIPTSPDNSLKLTAGVTADIIRSPTLFHLCESSRLSVKSPVAWRWAWRKTHSTDRVGALLKYSWWEHTLGPHFFCIWTLGHNTEPHNIIPTNETDTHICVTFWQQETTWCINLRRSQRLLLLHKSKRKESPAGKIKAGEQNDRPGPESL